MRERLSWNLALMVPGLLTVALSAAGCDQSAATVEDPYRTASFVAAADDAPASDAPAVRAPATTADAGAQPQLRSVLGAVGIGVSDLKRSTDFYTRVLGMKQTATYALGYMDEVIVAHDSPRGSSIALMHWTDSSKINYKDLPVKLVFYVADPKALAAKIKAEGLEVTREPAPVPTLGNAVVGLAKDPDGYVIEILQATGAGG